MAPSRDWVSHAKRILGVKNSDAWKATHSSFSAWLRDEAKTLEIQPSVLWRDVGAFEFYQALGSNYEGLALPRADDAAFCASPQHLELIEKLARSADRATIRELLQKAVSGGVTRSELLEQWNVYRSKGELTPRRGRGVSRKDREARAASPNLPLAEAKALLHLVQAPPDWIGSEAPESFRTFATPDLGQLSRRHFDLIVVCKPESNQQFDVHGVEVVRASSISDRVLRMVVNHLTYPKLFDYAWLALAADGPICEGIAREILTKLPNQIGLLQVSGSVAVLRAPTRQSDAQSGQLLAKLLLQT
jgi:hypothetical protein